MFIRGGGNENNFEGGNIVNVLYEVILVGGFAGSIFIMCQGIKIVARAVIYYEKTIKGHDKVSPFIKFISK